MIYILLAFIVFKLKQKIMNNLLNNRRILYFSSFLKLFKSFFTLLKEILFQQNKQQKSYLKYFNFDLSFYFSISKYLILLILLISRTSLSLKLSYVNGTMFKALLDQDLTLFNDQIKSYLLFSLPASLLNSGIIYLNNSIALDLRERLTYYLQDLYLRNNNFYKLIHLDSRITNIDNIITSDIKEWSINIANLFTNLAKPILDIFIYSYKLYFSLGIFTPLLVLCGM